MRVLLGINQTCSRFLIRTLWTGCHGVRFGVFGVLMASLSNDLHLELGRFAGIIMISSKSETFESGKGWSAHSGLGMSWCTMWWSLGWAIRARVMRELREKCSQVNSVFSPVLIQVHKPNHVDQCRTNTRCVKVLGWITRRAQRRRLLCLHLLPSGKLDWANIYFGFIAPSPSLRFRLFGEGETFSGDKTGVILYISSLEVHALIRFCLNGKRTPSSSAFGVLYDTSLCCVVCNFAIHKVTQHCGFADISSHLWPLPPGCPAFTRTLWQHMIILLWRERGDWYFNGV